MSSAKGCPLLGGGRGLAAMLTKVDRERGLLSKKRTGVNWGISTRTQTLYLFM